jgi:hypothetical protein
MADNFESQDRPVDIPAAQVVPAKVVGPSLDELASAAPRAATEIGKKLQDHANLITSLVFVVLTSVWLLCMPWSWRSKYDLPPEVDLCSRIQQAEIAGQQPVLLPAGCPSLPAPKSSSAGAVARTATPVSWTRLTPVSTVTVSGAGTAGASGDSDPVQELKNDLTVWNRYEYELKTFAWGKDVNWYLYSTLRVLVIILSALTPALIVAPFFKDRKFIAALPAAVVAIATGCISEFDFKDQAAAYTQALVSVQGEKTAFITRSLPWYDYSGSGSVTTTTVTTAGGTEATGTAVEPGNGSNKTTCGDNSVPYPKPGGYTDIRANFSCRIQNVWQSQNLSRVSFLRSGQGSSTAGGESGGGGGQTSKAAKTKVH